MQLLPEQEPLGLLIAATRRRIKQTVGRHLHPHRLSPQQFWFLVAIFEHQGCSLREVAERLRVDPPTASRVVAALVRRKLVEVQENRSDRRRCHLGLTSAGLARARQVHPLARRVRGAIEEGLSSDEKRALRGLLRRVIANMERFVPVLAAALALLGGACSDRAPERSSPAVPVVAATAVTKDVPVQVQAVGAVEALSTVSIRPQVGGVITAVHFREGADVKAGDLLFTIDPRPFEAALRQAESMLAKDEASARNAQLEAERGKSLFEEGILPKEQHDQLRFAADSLEAAVRADQAAVDKARLDLEYCTIRSPLDGRTGSLLVNRGNLVKAIDGGPLVVINRTDPIYVSFAVPEARLAAIKAARATGKLEVQAIVTGEEDRPVLGELSFLDNAVDKATGTIRMKATFTNRERRLWPGQFVKARLRLATRAGAVVIPSQAVQAGQSGSFVFVIKPDLTAEMRPVEVVGDSEGEVVVEKGIAAGERVVTDGQLRLVPGAKVELKEARS